MVMCRGKNRDHVKRQVWAVIDRDPMKAFSNDGVARSTQYKREGLARRRFPTGKLAPIDRHQSQGQLSFGGTKLSPNIRCEIISGQLFDRLHLIFTPRQQLAAIG